MKFFRRRYVKWGLGIVASMLVFVIFSNIWVVKSTKQFIYTSYDSLPNNSVALVLGTSKRLLSGAPNPFFNERIAAAASLYREGKVSHFLLSGDNRTRYYNEPEEMRKALINQGIPGEMITLDYAGLRTLDSIVRSKEIFGQNKIIIVTQPFHCYRALFISRYFNIDAVAFLIEGNSIDSSLKTEVREWLARSKAILDLYVLKTAPRHLGDKQPLDVK
jgi:SanA protein